MTLLVNSFEGGTSGIAITAGNSGGVSGNAFDTATQGSGATLNYDKTEAAHGLLSCNITTTSAAISEINWAASFGSGIATAYWRGYYFFTGNPSATIRLWNATTSGSSNCTVSLNSSGKITVTYGSGGTSFVTFTSSVPLNAWFRVEGMITISAAAGQVAAILYEPLDTSTPTETHTSAASLNTGTTGPTIYAWGNSSTVASVGPYWVDDVGLSSTGYIGPVDSVKSGGSGGALAALLTTM